MSAAAEDAGEMRVSLVVAVAENGVIGRGGDLPWRLPEDLRRFKRLTMGHHLVVGRKTWESIGRPLPGRKMIVVSRGAPELPDGVALAASVDEALEAARAAGDDEVFVAGGGEIYRLALPLADRIYLTRVEGDVEGDVCFAPLKPAEWTLVSSETLPADERHAHAHRFEVLDRRRTSG